MDITMEIAGRLKFFHFKYLFNEDAICIKKSIYYSTKVEGTGGVLAEKLEDPQQGLEGHHNGHMVTGAKKKKDIGWCSKNIFISREKSMADNKNW